MNKGMKHTLSEILYGFAAVCAIAVCSCTEIESEIIPEEGNIAQEALEATRLTIGLHGEGADTKLTYVEGDYEGRKAMYTYWSEGDVIIANATPSNEDNAYEFNLIDGDGTGNGVFECTISPNGYTPDNFNSNAWTIYFPGSRIQGEQDYLDISYSDQVQTGDNNTGHLKNYHSLRYRLTPIDQSIRFNNSYIDLSGDNLDESACMKFNISNLPSMIPVKIELTYYDKNGSISSIFHTHNYLTEWWGETTRNSGTTATMALKLEDFTETTSVTAYMMMSNASVTVAAGGKFKVSVTSKAGTKYYCEKTIAKDVTITGGTLNTITCNSWQEAGNIDGFDNPEDGIVVLQEASVGNGTDIVIMGDGFSAAPEYNHFGATGDYKTIMTQAYNDFFSIEPFTSLKPYFNVYYINAVSKDEHDAKPFTDAYGNQNGATQGTAETAFATEFRQASTNISGNNSAVLSYAIQAIKTKGGKNGTTCDESTATTRAHKALIMVMANVQCYAGTCVLSWSDDDYGKGWSIAYTALGKTPEERKWTTIHEAGGHGFGKLADEYGGSVSFNTNQWTELSGQHSAGVSRNIDRHWGTAETNEGYTINPPVESTTVDNVYWSDLVSTYSDSENMGVYVGANTLDLFFCRPTENSVMRNQFAENGHFFNAASRWAIWYRLMRLTESQTETPFKASKNRFLSFDQNLTITKNDIQTRSASGSVYVDAFTPTAPPVLIKGHWENGILITEE